MMSIVNECNKCAYLSLRSVAHSSASSLIDGAVDALDVCVGDTRLRPSAMIGSLGAEPGPFASTLEDMVTCLGTLSLHVFSSCN